MKRKQNPAPTGNTRRRATPNKKAASPFEKFMDTRPKRVRTPKVNENERPQRTYNDSNEPQQEKPTYERSRQPNAEYEQRRRDPNNRPRTSSSYNTYSENNQNERPARNRPHTTSPTFKKRHTKSNDRTPSFAPTPVPTDSRLNKFVANSGICSRRKADEYIAQGMVSVNDQVVIEMGYRVQPSDVVRFKGKVINPEVRKVYVLLNKPKNFISTASDEKGRKTILDIVKNACNERLYPVGRLDRDTTGLILLTNDGDLATKLSHPSSQVRKVYHVTLDKKVHPDDIQAISKGVTLEDGVAVVDGVDYMEGFPKNEVGIILHMGRNRMIRRIFEHLGYQVEKLDRIVYASLTKKDLPRGHWRHLTDMEIINLRHFTK